MGLRHKNESGFGAVEGIIIVVIILMLGAIGYMVYHNNYKAPDKTAKTTTTTTKTTETTTTTPEAATTSYFAVKEWGVEAPYTGEDTFTYTLSGDSKVATIISKDLATKDTACATTGAGTIKQLAPTDHAYEDGTGPTVEEYAKTHADLYTHLGNYYYQFTHSQSGCGSVSADDQNKANDAVKALVATFIVIPS